MCGIAGIWTNKALNLEQFLGSMGDSLEHRGPDDSGTWLSNDHGVGLLHKRLSIVDLSPNGHQPMVSANGRYVITFNGEIYNFAEIKREIGSTSYPFKGGSDTEVMLAAFQTWGIEDSIPKFNGMFAFAVWDREALTLTLARDRVGKKPLYYYSTDTHFLFASELKALKCLPFVSTSVSKDAVANLLSYGYIAAPGSIYNEVSKLTPGSFVVISKGKGIGEGFKLGLPSRYWSIESFVSGSSALEVGDENLVFSHFEGLLKQATKERLVSDVPLGAFLSGGIDSSLIVALMTEVSNATVKTFSIGFKEGLYDESQYAAAVAKHFYTEHHELLVEPKDALDIIPTLPSIYDEPFADPSQIPTILLSRLTKNYVTVALSGDGGDELCCGYSRYLDANLVLRLFSRLPGPLKYLLPLMSGPLTPGMIEKLLLPAKSLFPGYFDVPNLGEKIKKLGSLASSIKDGKLYGRLVRHWDRPELLLKDPPKVSFDLEPLLKPRDFSSFLEYMQYWDINYYLPDDILVKVDRASMANALEVRAPLLDHRLMEYAISLPEQFKIRAGKGKYLLRKLLSARLPAELIDRPKRGFSVPIDLWLRGPLRPWAENLLSDRVFGKVGVLEPALVREKWKEHVSGKRNWQYYLWNVLMLNAWFELWEK